MTSPAAGGAAEAAAGQGTGQPGGGVQPGGQQPAGQGAGGQQDPNAMYAKYLEGIPAQLHGQVTGAFKAWDADVTRNQQDVRSQLAAYQPLIDSGADPQQLQAAAQFMEWLQEDPQAALAMAAQELGVDWGTAEGAPAGQGGPGDEGAAGSGDPQGEIPPWFAPVQQQFGELQQLVETMAQGMVQQHQSQQFDQQVDELHGALTSSMKAAGIEDGDADAQEFILAQLYQTPESVPAQQAAQQAVAKWQQLAQKFGGQQASANAPTILPAGGGLPTQQVDPKSLSQKDRRALAVQSAMRHMSGGQ